MPLLLSRSTLLPVSRKALQIRSVKQLFWREETRHYAQPLRVPHRVSQTTTNRPRVEIRDRSRSSDIDRPCLEAKVETRVRGQKVFCPGSPLSRDSRRPRAIHSYRRQVLRAPDSWPGHRLTWRLRARSAKRHRPTEKRAVSPRRRYRECHHPAGPNPLGLERRE